MAADVPIVVQMYADDVLGQVAWFAESSLISEVWWFRGNVA